MKTIIILLVIASSTLFAQDSTKINDLKAVCIFDSLEYGAYAIKAIHDEDSDGKMTTNFFGMPSEDYGFSNDATGSMGPAD